MISKILNTYQKYGLKNFLAVTVNELVPRRAQCLPQISEIVSSGRGLEIGGPSPVFRNRGAVPVYSLIDRLDNCNFSSDTTWEGQIEGGKTFHYSPDRNPGTQFISEASDLGQIESGSYDFLLSSHALEHLANPLQGLSEWLRVLKDSGTLVLLVPHYSTTFDHRRPITTLEHLIDDFDQQVGEDDLTHLDEILEFHDLSVDPGAGTPEEFAQRSRDNFNNRCLHQHVFDNKLVVQLLTHMGLQISAIENMKPNHILTIANKIPADMHPENERFLEDKSGQELLVRFH